MCSVAGLYLLPSCTGHLAASGLQQGWHVPWGTCCPGGCRHSTVALLHLQGHLQGCLVCLAIDCSLTALPQLGHGQKPVQLPANKTLQSARSGDKQYKCSKHQSAFPIIRYLSHCGSCCVDYTVRALVLLVRKKPEAGTKHHCCAFLQQNQPARSFVYSPEALSTSQIILHNSTYLALRQQRRLHECQCGLQQFQLHGFIIHSLDLHASSNIQPMRYVAYCKGCFICCICVPCIPAPCLG